MVAFRVGQIAALETEQIACRFEFSWPGQVPAPFDSGLPNVIRFRHRMREVEGLTAKSK